MHDFRRIASHFTPSRIGNMARLISGYYLSRITGVPRQWGLPYTVSIEPTTSCNLRCPECPSGLRSFSRPTGMLDKALFKQIAGQLSSHCVYMNFYFQGEPYLHPDFFDLVKIAKTHGYYTSTSTNAHFLDEERAAMTVESGLDRLIISIDGTDQKTYSGYRKGGSLDKVIEGTKRLVAIKQRLKKQTPYLVFQFLVVRHNEHQVGEIMKLGKALGVDHVALKTAQVENYEEGSPLIPRQQKYSRYKQLPSGKWIIKNKLENHCWRMWSGAVITWDGRVVPCCFDKDAQHQMGNLNDTSFEDIWRSDQYQRFRGLILKSRSEIDMCRNCSEGTRVWA
ncbi:MAG: radical SAM protein [Salibacteraceae bacterium]